MVKNNDFEKKVLQGLFDCNVDLQSLGKNHRSLGAAVSGGADSVSLLCSLARICKPYDIPVKVITVNHFIRKDEETCGDVEYVCQLCKDLCDKGFDISFEVKNLCKGEVFSYSKENGCGVEAAARDLRYKAFEEFITKYDLDFLCLAHNKNDQVETALMRFLQGGSVYSSSCIPQVRQKFIRPLLNISRTQIEEYLLKLNVLWRYDSTNLNNEYLRNKIRNELVPFLNEKFTGWDKSVLLGVEKAVEEAKILQDATEELFEKCVLNQNTKDTENCSKTDNKIICLDGKMFYQQPTALKIRLITKCLNCLGVNDRIPYVFLRDLCRCADNFKEDRNGKKGGGKILKSFSDITIIFELQKVCIKKECKINNEIGFSVIIEKGGNIDLPDLPFGNLFIPEELDFPVLLRNCMQDDFVLTSEKQMKKVRDIFADWHVSPELRSFIPVVQELKNPEQNIVCILGSYLGFKDWIVK